jgi:hypothetical protein
MTVLQALQTHDHLTREQLCNLTGNTDRYNRDQIHKLRKHGVHIISSPQRAGYWIGGQVEWNFFTQRFNRVLMGSLLKKDYSNKKQRTINDVVLLHREY